MACREINRHRFSRFPEGKIGIIAGPEVGFSCHGCRVKFQILSLLFRRLFGPILSCFIVAAASWLGVGAASGQESRTLLWDANRETDIAGYKVHLGTSSGVYSTIQDVGNVTTQVIPGLSPGTIYYCAVQAYSTAGLVSGLSPEISFAIPSAAMPFSEWASAGGLAGISAAPGADPFHDGVGNLLKFAFNMNPSAADARRLVSGTGNAGLPVCMLDTSGTQASFKIEFLRRKGSGLVYTPKVSSDLTDYQPLIGATIVTDIDSNWERVVMETPVSIPAQPKLFGTVEVVMP